MASRTAYNTWTPQKPTLFSGHYLRNRSTLDIGVLGYIGIVQHKEHSPEVLSIPPGTSCIWDYTQINMAVVRKPHISGMLQCIPTIYPTDRISVSKICFRTWRQFNAACVYIEWKQQDSPTQFLTHLFHTLFLRSILGLLLGALPKLRRATISFVMSVCLSVRPPARTSARVEQLCSHWMDFHEVLYLIIFENQSRKFKFH